MLLLCLSGHIRDSVGVGLQLPLWLWRRSAVGFNGYEDVLDGPCHWRSHVRHCWALLATRVAVWGVTVLARKHERVGVCPQAW